MHLERSLVGPRREIEKEREREPIEAAHSGDLNSAHLATIGRLQVRDREPEINSLSLSLSLRDKLTYCYCLFGPFVSPVT